MATSIYDGFISAKNASDQAKAKRAKAKALQDKSDLAMVKAGFERDSSGNLVTRNNSDQDVKEQENALIKKQLGVVTKRLTLQDSDAALTDYLATGDANNLQRALSNNEQLSDLYKQQGVYQVANIDFEHDKAILQRAGLAVEDLDFDNKKELIKKSMFKYYDGKQWQIANTESLVARTGISKRATAAQLKIINDFTAARVQAAKGLAEEDVKLARDTQKTKNMTEQANAVTDRIKANTKLTGNVDKFRELAQKDRALDLKDKELNIRANKQGSTNNGKLDNGKPNKAFDSLGKLDTKSKQISRADAKVQDMLDAHFEGSRSKFMTADLSKNPELRRTAKKAIDDMLNLKGIKPSAFIQRKAIELSELTGLAARAGNISKTDVGWFDDTVQQVSKYFTNNKKLLGNIEAKAAFEAYKGILRVAMIGAAQTPTETRNFNKMLGSMKQQPRAVLTQLRSSIMQLRTKYRVVSDFMQSDLAAKIYVGRDLKSLDKTIAAIDDSLRVLDNKSSTGKPTKRSKELDSAKRLLSNKPKQAISTPTRESAEGRLSAKEWLKRRLETK